MPKNGTSSGQIFERTPKTSRNTPQNDGVGFWFMRFHFRASNKPIFENHVFRAVSGPFHPLYETKISNRSPSVVYGSITLEIFSGALGTSPHQWFNQGNKIQKKCFFGTLFRVVHQNFNISATSITPGGSFAFSLPYGLCLNPSAVHLWSILKLCKLSASKHQLDAMRWLAH